MEFSTVPLGLNQGLKIGKVGYVSNKNPNHSMNDWVVVTVKKQVETFQYLTF